MAEIRRAKGTASAAGAVYRILNKGITVRAWHRVSLTETPCERAEGGPATSPSESCVRYAERIANTVKVAAQA